MKKAGVVRINEPWIILFILFSAVFNDVLRIGDTTISLYRMLFPVSIYVIIRNYHCVKNWIRAYLLLVIATPIQHYVSFYVWKIGNEIDVLWMLRFLVHYLFIVIVFCLVWILYERYRGEFDWLKNTGIFIYGYLCIFSYPLIASRVLSAANYNNYACSIAAFIPFLLRKIYLGRRRYYAVIVVAAAELAWFDSKAALMGVIIELLLFLALTFSVKIKEGKRLIPFLVVCAALAGLGFALSSITINGYPIREMFVYMLGHIRNGEMVLRRESSLTYRTDVIVYLIQLIKSTFFAGVGVGNTSKAIVFIDPWLASEKESLGLSSHICWLEFICDIGIIAFIIILAGIQRSIKKIIFFDKKGYNLCYVCFFVSFFMWSISASGIYTTFYVFVTMAILLRMESEENAVGENVNYFFGTPDLVWR